MRFKPEIQQAVTGSISAGLLLNLIVRLNKQFQTTKSRREKIIVIGKLIALNISYIMLLKRL